MIQSLLHNRWSLTAVLADKIVTKRQYRYLNLSPAHWVNFEDLSKVLEHLEVAKVFLSEENNVLISAVLHGLIATLEVNDGDFAFVKEFKRKVSAALTRRYELDDLCPSEIPLLASALDPRFFNFKFLNDRLKLDVKFELIRLAQQS